MLYVHEDVRLADVIRRGLADYASTNSLPIRVLFGRFSTFTPGAWSAEEATACGTSLDVCQATGVTLVVWGAATEQYGSEQEQLPGVFFTDGRPRTLEIKEMIRPQEGAIAQALDLEADGLQFGEFKERTVWLFLYMDLIPDPDKLNLDVLLFEPIRKSLDTELLATFSSQLEDRAAAAFARLMVSSPERRLREQRTRIEEQEIALTTHERQITTIRSQLDLQRREFDQILESMQMPEEYWKQEWKHISEHPKIVKGTLTMSEQRVQFETVLLNITDQDTESEIPLGRFRVAINMENGEVTLNNINNRRRDRDHPHVTRGNPCWGGYHSELIDHVQSNRLAALVEFIISYLQTYNPEDDWGRHIRLWRDEPALVSA